MGVRNPSPTPGSPAQSSSAKKISAHNFWLQTQQGLSQWKKLLESQPFPLKNPNTDLLRFSLSELQLWAA